MAELLKVSDAELYYDHVYALKGVSLSVQEGNGRADRCQWCGQVLDPAGDHGAEKIRKGEIHYEGRRIDGTRSDEIVKMGIAMVPEGRRVFPYMSVRDNLMMGAFTRSSKADIANTLEMVLGRFPRLKERYSQAAGTMSGGEQQMLVIGRALSRSFCCWTNPLGVAPKLVQDIARSIVAINRDEKVSVLLVEQNSRMALRISQRAYALTTGKIVLSGNSEELATDDRVKKLYLGGEI